MGARKESSEALEVHKGSASVDRHDLSVDRAVLRLDLAHALPGACKLQPPYGQLHLSVLVLATNDLELSVVADQHEVLQVVHTLHRRLIGREERRRLAADVDQRAARLVLHHLTNDDIANLHEPTADIRA